MDNCRHYHNFYPTATLTCFFQVQIHSVKSAFIQHSNNFQDPLASAADEVKVLQNEFSVQRQRMPVSHLISLTHENPMSKCDMYYSETPDKNLMKSNTSAAPGRSVQACSFSPLCKQLQDRVRNSSLRTSFISSHLFSLPGTFGWHILNGLHVFTTYKS